MNFVDVRRAAEHLPAPRRGRGFLPFITIGERLLELPLNAVPGSDEKVEVAESASVIHRAPPVLPSGRVSLMYPVMRPLISIGPGALRSFSVIDMSRR